MDNKRCSPVFLSNQGILKWEGMGHTPWWRRKSVVTPKQYQPSDTLGRNEASEPSSSLCELMAEFLICAVVHLILFYENRLKDHHLVIPSVLRGLKALVSPFFHYTPCLQEPLSSEFSLCPLGVRLRVLGSRCPNVWLSCVSRLPSVFSPFYFRK